VTSGANARRERAMMHTVPLAPGYHPLPPGHLANVVTCLEMTARPVLRPPPAGGDFALERMGAADTERFRALFRAIGEDIMWFSRLILPEERLAAILGDPLVESFAMTGGSGDIGLLELDFREAGQCELSFFGLVPGLIGKGAGRWLMNEALTRAWSRPIARLWVHTCSYDSPQALPFYMRSGFRPYQMMVEVHPDPRLTGHMPKHASPAAPLIEG
jgi:GNAT superfamily N-acetyltransferase